MTRTAPGPHDDSLDARLTQLEALLEAARPAAAAGRSAATADLDPSTLDRLAAIADRLRRLHAVIDERLAACEWDGADRLAARLLLDHLATATRDCRTVAAAAAVHLGLAERAVEEIVSALDREQQRAATFRS